jgi:hypothetical protein
MNQRGLEVADVFQQYGARYLQEFGPSLSVEQRRVLQAISLCRTAALGGHVERCDGCGHRTISYNSCRNRHCPKCQAAARAEWMEARAQELLPVPYFHVVFTLPDTLAPIALQNKRIVYGVLFRAVAETLKDIAAEPKYLGAEIGFLAVLHTWGQNLMHHPHVHCVVPAGGISPDGQRWLSCKEDFFLPVRVLSSVFRGKFIDFLKRAFRQGHLRFFGKLECHAKPAQFEQLVNAAVRHKWVVYAKRPFGGPTQVLKYLARYTHRIAISNKRILDLRDGQVRFQYKDYADGNQTKAMTLDALEFIRRFLMHVLPSGFMRIRHFGFLGNRHRQARLELCRRLLGAESGQETGMAGEPSQTDRSAAEHDVPAVCPACGNGRMSIIETFHPEAKAVSVRRPFLMQGLALRAKPDTS